MKAFKLKSEVIHSGLQELRAFDLSSLSIYASFKFYLRCLCHNCLCYLSIKDVVSFLKRFNLFITSLNMKRCPSLRVKIPIPFIMMGAFSFPPNFCVPPGGTVPTIPVHDFRCLNMLMNDNIHITFVHILKSKSWHTMLGSNLVLKSSFNVLLKVPSAYLSA
jgi:hypothetical protein